MNIKALKTYRITFKLRAPYQIAGQHIDRAENIIVRIDTSDGKTGWGNCAPDPHVTGEEISASEAFLKDVVSDLLKGQDALRIRFLDEMLANEGKQYRAARAGVSIALFDLLGKKVKQPLYRLLGGFRDRILTSVTIGISAPNEAVTKAQILVKQGIKALKLKIGAKVSADVETISAVRHAVGEAIELRLDANEGYEVGEALRLLRELKKRGIAVEFLEQPTRAGELYALKQVALKSEVPIMADESVLDASDALMLAGEWAVHALNIKLMKCGGINAARELDSVARAAGLATMIGCNDESRISIAAALHFALASPNVRYADLDGHLDLQNDVATGGLRLKDGYLYPLERPGLGVNVKM